MTAVQVQGGDLTRALGRLGKLMDSDLAAVRRRARFGAESKGQRRRRREHVAAFRKARAERRWLARQG